MEEIVKDAPCLCKEDCQENIAVKQSFFQKVHYYWLRLWACAYQYPVMYDDGTVSKMKCDRVGHTPLGIIFENHLMSLKISQNKMSWDRAMEYCKSVKLLGRECEAGSTEFWDKFRDRKKELIKIFSSLGIKSSALCKSYWTYEKEERYAASVSIHDQEIDWIEQYRKSYAFPVLDLSDEYAYPVMYDDGTISTLKKDKMGRKALGVVFENHLITLTDSPYKMTWTEAMNYCRSIKVLGEKCEDGSAEFWRKCFDKEANKKISAILSYLGGEVLGFFWSWTTTEWGSRCAKDYNADYWLSKNDFGIVGKNGFRKIRPVLDLGKLPLEVTAKFVWLT